MTSTVQSLKFLIPNGTRLPAFLLPSSRGVALGPPRYRQRKHLVLLCLDPERPADQAYLATVAQLYAEFREMDTEVLALLPQTPGDLAALAGDLALPFPLLADDGTARARLLPADTPATVVAALVADRYGIVTYQMVAADAAALAPPEEVLAWARFLGMQCAECSDAPDG
jgi:peroxiredoxin